MQLANSIRKMAFLSLPFPNNCSTYILLMKLANSVRKMAFLSLLQLIVPLTTYWCNWQIQSEKLHFFLFSFPTNCSTYFLLMKLANAVRKIAFLCLPFSNKLFHLLSIDEIGKFSQKNCISFPSPINCSTYILLMKLANAVRKIAFLSLLQ